MDFLSTVYKFYPQEIEFLSANGSPNKAYINSNAFKRLEALKEEMINENFELGDLLIKHFRAENYLVNDISAIVLGDRAYTVQFSFFEENRLIALCFTFSIIIENFTYYIFEVLLDESGKGWKETIKCSRESERYSQKKEVIKKVCAYIISNSSYRLFPEKLLLEKVYNVSYHEITFGNFNYFNAFFMDKEFAIG